MCERTENYGTKPSSCYWGHSAPPDRVMAAKFMCRASGNSKAPWLHSNQSRTTIRDVLNEPGTLRFILSQMMCTFEKWLQCWGGTEYDENKMWFYCVTSGDEYQKNNLRHRHEPGVQTRKFFICWHISTTSSSVLGLGKESVRACLFWRKNYMNLEEIASFLEAVQGSARFVYFYLEKLYDFALQV